MGSTETIRERTVNVYVPSIEMKRRWQDFALQRGESLSKMIIQAVTHTIGQLSESAAEENYSTAVKMNDLESESRDLREENRRLKMALETLEVEIRRYRFKPFYDPNVEGMHRFDDELVQCLRDAGKPVSNERMMQLLGVTETEVNVIRSITNQLDSLRNHGMIRYTQEGWIWAE